jgi:O-antigen/teichoic acid export membrane protein
MAMSHLECPRVLVPSILVNTFSLQIPTLLILGMYGAKTAGVFAVAQRVVGLPMRLLGATFAQTFLTEISHRNRTNPSGVSPFFRKGLAWLTFGAVLLTVVTTFMPRTVYLHLFGDGWGDVRDIARWVGIAAGAQFVGSPLAQTLIALNAQRTMLAWDLTRLAIVLIAFRGAYVIGLDPVHAIGAYAIGAGIAYLLLIVVCYRKIRHVSSVARDPLAIAD